MGPKKKNKNKKASNKSNAGATIKQEENAEKIFPEPATEEVATEEMEHDRRLKLEAEKEAQEEMQVAFINLMNGVQGPYCVDDGDQSSVSGDAAQKLKWKWANGLDWNPNNPLMSNWMRVLAAGDYDAMLKEIESTPKEKVAELIERRETLYKISALFHVIKGATRTLNEAGTHYVTTAKFVDHSKAPRHFQCVLKLIELGARVNARDMLGATPMFYCTMRLRNPVTMKIAKILVDNGADVNAVNRLGETALVQPLLNKRFDCVKFLLKYGADPTIRDNEGTTVEALFKMDSDFKQLLEDSKNNAGLLSKDSSASEELCPLCDQPSRNRCTGCYLTRYCSKECQLAHWKKHKKTCKATQSQFQEVQLVPVATASGEETNAAGSLSSQKASAAELPMKENFIVKVQLIPTVNEKEGAVNSMLGQQSAGLLTFHDVKNGLLGGVKEGADCYAPLMDIIKNSDSDFAYFQTVVDKEKKLRVNVQKPVLNQTW